MTKQDQMHETPDNDMNIEDLKNQAKALDGKIFALLSPSEFEIFYFFCKEGRKYNVSIGVELVTGEFVSDQLRFVKYSESYQKIFATNAKVKVTFK